VAAEEPLSFQNQSNLVLLWFVVYFSFVQKPSKRLPALIASGVILLVCFARWCQFGSFESLERMTYDSRARLALKFTRARPPT